MLYLLFKNTLSNSLKKDLKKSQVIHSTISIPLLLFLLLNRTANNNEPFSRI